MMNLNSTNEEIEALKYFLGNGNKAMNQLLISNCETDIALLSDEVENEVVSISYDRESIISNLMKIKALYTLILKQFYKTNHRTREFFRGTNLAEVDRLKNEPFIDKIISATKNQDEAETNFASKWNRPTCINIKLDLNVPYLIVKNVLEENEDEILIAPFTKIKDFELFEEKPIANTSKNVKVYKISLEKQELEDLTDRERFGLYNYILDNAYLIKRKLEECIKLEKENAINFENIRKLEQLLVKYENSVEEKESDEEYSDINRQSDYDDIERINKELEELKNITTEVFEKRKDNINFINMWKRNIAVYMMAECREIEKKFADMETVPDKKEEETAQETKVVNLYQNINPEESTCLEESSQEAAIEETDFETSSETIETVEDEKDEEETEEIDETEEKDKTAEIDENVESKLIKRVKLESKENIEATEELIKNIKILITKQQNHARIAGNIGSIYSALNNAFEMKSVAENLLEMLTKVDLKVQEASQQNQEERLEEISKANIEISTLINYLNNPKIALKNTKVTRFEEMAIIEENELKRGIAEKIREIRGEAELKKLKDDLEYIEDKPNFKKILGIFNGQRKIDDFMIEQIEIRQKAIRRNLSKRLSLAYNYSIHELMAEIEMFIEDNDDDYLIEDDVLDLKEIAEELKRNYIISESKVHSILQKKTGKNLPVDSRKITKFEKMEIDTYRFLNKYGYDIELRSDEPKYQDTMASEISRIIEYINSSKIF